ncbi:DUF3850 domain-containing protein [Chryseobacterium arthrosphaerae]
MIHELKTLPEYFAMLWCGSKNFELRKDDRDYKVHDELLLKEFDPEKGYTGRMLHRKVEYILRGGQFGLANGYCIMSIRKL